MQALRNLIEQLLSNFISGTLLDVAAALLLVVSIILIAMILVRVVNKSLLSLFQIKKDDRQTLTIGRLIQSITKVVVWFIVIVTILSELNIDIAPFIASAGIVGFAFGFGAQAVVKDFIIGFFFILEQAFYLDDIIEVNGFKGKVIKMGLRTTSIMNWTGQVKIISNGDITNLINFSKSDSIAIVDFGVDYSTDLKKISTIMPKFLDHIEKTNELIVEAPSFLGVTDLADSSINLRIIAKTVSNEQFGVERYIRKELVNFLNENEVNIPFPQIVVHNAK